MAEPGATYRKAQDNHIKATGARYIDQRHITASLEKLLLQKGSLTLKKDARQRLEEVLTDDEQHRGNGMEGLKCNVVGPRNVLFDVKIKFVGDDCLFDTDWDAMMYRCKIDTNAVLSIWGYRQDGRAQFIFRVDAYGEENCPLPAPLTVSGGQEEANTTSIDAESEDKGCLCALNGMKNAEINSRHDHIAGYLSIMCGSFSRVFF